MYVVCAVTGDENAGDYNYAVIELTGDYLQWLRGVNNIAKVLRAVDENLYGCEYFDYNAEYYRELPQGLDIDSDQFVRIEQVTYDAFAQFDQLPTGVTTVLAKDEGWLWQGTPKHSQGTFETPTLTLEVLHALATEG